eukprot:TRINITY_DN3062_c0_g1_i2.p1 TRINITY_DN3062_c0_g1~~TRINITY_DN3062_c0_g1_i2.p1  ORF type:complete len:470 (-),score=86.12 TRINITY_DN3062_c0_g1_i2:704-2113(-)
MSREGLVKRSTHEERASVKQHDRLVGVAESFLDDADQRKKDAGHKAYSKSSLLPLYRDEDDEWKKTVLMQNDWMHAFNKYGYLTIVTFLSFVTRYIHIDYPAEVVFDEVHFGGFTNMYVKGTHFFDIHPPLAKLMFGFVAHLIGYDGHFNFEHITNKYDGDFYIYLRCMPAFFGSLIAPLAYLTLKELGASEHASFAAGLMIVFETCILVESRIIVTDAIMMFFISASIYCYAKVINAPFRSYSWYGWLLATGLCLGGCISVKWTALATMALVGLETFISLLQKWSTQNKSDRIIDWGTKGVLLFIVPITIYVISWVLHIHFLPNAGPGDIYTSAPFRKRLIGNKEGDDIQPIGILQAVYQFQGQLYIYNQGIISPHAWMSAWWTWPFMVKGVAYWSKVEGNRKRYIYLMGNPIIWWFTTLVLFAFVVSSILIPFRSEDLYPLERRFLSRGMYWLFGFVNNIMMPSLYG